MYISLGALVLIVISAFWEYADFKKRERRAEERIATLEKQLEDCEQELYDCKEKLQPQHPYTFTDHEIP